jgi:hypothetical protein
MAAWLLILMASNGPIHTEMYYTSLERCERAGKIWVQDMNRLVVWFKCIPNDSQLKKEGESR